MPYDNYIHIVKFSNFKIIKINSHDEIGYQQFLDVLRLDQFPSRSKSSLLCLAATFLLLQLC